MKRKNVNGALREAEVDSHAALLPTSPPLSLGAADVDDDDVDDSPSSSPPPLTSFPPAFLAWLSAHNLSPLIYSLSTPLPRYLRLNPRLPLPLSTLEAELGTPLLPTPLTSIYRVSPSIRLAPSPAYKAGHIYGIDLASALSVHCLFLPPSSPPPPPPPPPPSPLSTCLTCVPLPAPS